MPTANAIPDNKQVIRQFFDSIAGKYDFLNKFLSFQMDESWRKRALKIVFDPSQEKILDLGVGTGKFLKLFTNRRKWKSAVAVDFSEEMLKEARRQLPEYVEFFRADFHDLPFESDRFDLIISSFTLRSVKEMDVFLKGIHRILSPNGKVAFLCLTRPDKFWFKALYYPYLKFYLPLVGGFFSGNKDAYNFLAASIMNFQDPVRTAEMMHAQGFSDTRLVKFSLGMATLIVGKK